MKRLAPWACMLALALGLAPAIAPAAEDRNDAVVRSLAEKGAARGDPVAKSVLEMIKHGNLDDGQNGAILGTWVADAARRNEPEAQHIVGFFEESKKDYARAAEWYLKAAKQGFAPAQVSLASLYLAGKGVAKDAASAATWARKAAEQNDPYGQVLIGALHTTGEGGVPKDPVKAAEWFEKAALQGNDYAQFVTGSDYINGRGVPPSLKKAEYWYRKAAEGGNANAKKAMAAPAAARELVAAQAGDAEAQYGAGVKYLRGSGGQEKNAGEAFKWFTKASDQGHPAAQLELGVMYLKGVGVARNDREAVRLIRSAAEKENPTAMATVGFWYEKGQGGLPKDPAMAESLYRKAEAKGSRVATRQLQRLGK